MFPELISLWQFVGIVVLCSIVGSAVGFYGVFKFMQFLEAPAKPKHKVKRKYTRKAKLAESNDAHHARVAEALTPPVQRKPRAGGTPGVTSAVLHEVEAGTVQHTVQR